MSARGFFWARLRRAGMVLADGRAGDPRVM